MFVFLAMLHVIKSRQVGGSLRLLEQSTYELKFWGVVALHGAGDSTPLVRDIMLLYRSKRRF